MKMRIIDWIGFALVVIGSLNWGLVGAFNFNLVEFFLGKGILARIVYMLVGLSIIYAITYALLMQRKKK